MPKPRVIPNLDKKYPHSTPPLVTQPEAPLLQERMVRILDADFKEYEGNEDHPYVTKMIWLLLEDMETGAILRSPLNLEDIQRITNMSRQLQGRELYKFADLLKAREEPLRLVVDMSQEDISEKDIGVDLILARAKQEIRTDEEVEDELSKLNLPKPAKAKSVTRFQFDLKKFQKLQEETNNE